MSRQATTSRVENQSYRTVEFKLYPTKAQEATLLSWMRTCCYVYNQALEHRIKAWKRRRESVTLFDQIKLLTKWRRADSKLAAVPVEFLRDALRRVDRGMNGFFRRVKAKQAPGFPRFRAGQRYRSMEVLYPAAYAVGGSVRVPKLGEVRARGPFARVGSGTQPLLRVLRRAGTWYAQVLTLIESTPLPPTNQSVGIDLGLASLITTDTGEHVGNPRLLRRTTRKLRVAQKTLSRRKKGSNRRRKAVQRVAKLYDRLQRRRKGLAHRVSRDLVNRFDTIVHEDLNLKGLTRSRLRKSILDAAWGRLLRYISYKAASAGRQVIAVDPRGTSQECPSCGLVTPKQLSDREHNCPCGLRCDRDHAAARVIQHRGFSPGRGGPVSPGATQAGPVKRKGSTGVGLLSGRSTPG